MPLNEKKMAQVFPKVLSQKTITEKEKKQTNGPGDILLSV